MAVKNRKIRMPGMYLESYRVTFLTYIKLQLIRCYLFGLRTWRRIRKSVEYCKTALIIIPFWAVYVMVAYIWGTYKMGGYLLSDILWDMKLSFFSSVIITAGTLLITQCSKHRNAYAEQHRVYVNVMGKCSQLYKDLAKVLFEDETKEYIPFWPFYTTEMYHLADENYTELKAFDKDSPEFRVLLKSLEEAKCAVSELGQNLYNGSYAEVKAPIATEKIESCNQCFEILGRFLEREEEIINKSLLMWQVSHGMFDLIEYLRYPWRKDLKWKVKALELIYKEDKSVAQTFYDEAFLGIIN